MKKNILVFNAHDLDCGAGKSCAATMEILARAGYNIVHVAVSKGRIEEILNKSGIPTIYCSFPCWYPMESNGVKMNFIQRLRYIQYSLRKEIIAIIKVKKELMSMGFRPDIIYTNTVLFPIGTHLANIYKVPHIFHVREYGYEDFKMYFVLGTKLSSYLSKINTVKALCISKGVQKVWLNFFGNKAELLYNGISNPNDSFVNRDFNGKSFNVILVGRLSEEKGQEFVIRRLAKIQAETNIQLFLDLWGDGKDRDKLKKIVEELKLSDFVHFCGFSDKINYSKYHLAIMSSRSEGFGRTTVEYMFNSIPVIGYEGGATPELIKDKVTGRLYKTDEDFDKCVLDALSSYSNYQCYAKNAFKFACENFTIEKYQAKILDVFKNQIN